MREAPNEKLKRRCSRLERMECRLPATIAMAADFLSVKAALEAAVKRRPGVPIMLRQKARVRLKSDG